MTTGIMSLVGKRISKRVKFLGDDVTIFKLTVGEVKEIQEKAKVLNAEDESNVSDDAGLDILRTVVRLAVEGASELQDEHFEQWPMDELSALSGAIMKFSGIGEDQGK